jgi:hypothetical protein
MEKKFGAGGVTPFSSNQRPISLLIFVPLFSDSVTLFSTPSLLLFLLIWQTLQINYFNLTNKMEGNPVWSNPNYANQLVISLPSLVKLDQQDVTQVLFKIYKNK